MANFKLIVSAIVSLLSVGLGLARGEEAFARSALEVLAKDESLRLSSDGRTAADHFSFVWLSNSGRKRGDSLETRVTVERRGEDAAAVIRVSNGLPVCYVRDGLMISVDPDEPGSLLLHESAHFKFQSAIEPGKGLTVDMVLSSGARSSSTTLEIRDVIAALLPKMKNASFAPDQNHLLATTENAEVRISTTDGSPDPSKFKINEIDLSSIDGGRQAFLEIRLAAPKGGGLTVGSARTLNDLASKNDHVHRVAEPLPEQSFPLPAAGFWQNPKGVNACKELDDLIKASNAPPADSFRRDTLDVLDEIRDLAGRTGVSREQSIRLDRLFEQYRSRFEHVADKVLERKLDAISALAEVKRTMMVAGEIATVLEPKQYLQFARLWAANDVVGRNPDPVAEMLSTLSGALVQVELGDEQRQQLAAAILHCKHDVGEIRARVVTGELDKEPGSTMLKSVSSELTGALHRTLSAEQYKRVEEILRDGGAPRPARKSGGAA